jgi:nicotinate phosphoribosyltransferase
MALGKGELGAFKAYADVYPDDCILLVDTIDTLGSGIPNAIRVFEELRRRGHKPAGIRLDSGDLAYLSIQAAKMLNAAGFPEVKIVLSNQLDELTIWQIITQIQEEAPRYGLDPDDLIGRFVYGVGTRLITSEGKAALDGVYKLVAIQDKGKWMPSFKVSETLEKAINPGHKVVWRIYDRRDKATVDLISLDDEDPNKANELSLHHSFEEGKHRVLPMKEISKTELLLIDILREGKLVYSLPSIDEMRELRNRDMERLDSGVKRLVNPHIYHVSLTERLWNLKQKLISSVK